MKKIASLILCTIAIPLESASDKTGSDIEINHESSDQSLSAGAIAGIAAATAVAAGAIGVGAYKLGKRLRKPKTQPLPQDSPVQAPQKVPGRPDAEKKQVEVGTPNNSARITAAATAGSASPELVDEKKKEAKKQRTRQQLPRSKSFPSLSVSPKSEQLAYFDLAKGTETKPKSKTTDDLDETKKEQDKKEAEEKSPQAEQRRKQEEEAKMKEQKRSIDALDLAERKELPSTAKSLIAYPVPIRTNPLDSTLVEGLERLQDIDNNNNIASDKIEPQEQGQKGRADTEEEVKQALEDILNKLAKQDDGETEAAAKESARKALDQNRIINDLKSESQQQQLEEQKKRDTDEEETKQISIPPSQKEINFLSQLIKELSQEDQDNLAKARKSLETQKGLVLADNDWLELLQNKRVTLQGKTLFWRQLLANYDQDRFPQLAGIRKTLMNVQGIANRKSEPIKMILQPVTSIQREFPILLNLPISTTTEQKVTAQMKSKSKGAGQLKEARKIAAKKQHEKKTISKSKAFQVWKTKAKEQRLQKEQAAAQEAKQRVEEQKKKEEQLKKKQAEEKRLQEEQRRKQEEEAERQRQQQQQLEEQKRKNKEAEEKKEEVVQVQQQALKPLSARIEEQANAERLVSALFMPASSDRYSGWAQDMGNSVDDRMADLLQLTNAEKIIIPMQNKHSRPVKVQLINDIINEPVKDLLMQASGAKMADGYPISSDRYPYLKRVDHQKLDKNKKVPVIALTATEKKNFHDTGVNDEDLTYDEILKENVESKTMTQWCKIFFKTGIDGLHAVGRDLVCIMYDKKYEALADEQKKHLDTLATQFATNVEIEIKRHFILKKRNNRKTVYTEENYKQALDLFNQSSFQAYLPPSPVLLLAKVITLPKDASIEDKKQFHWLKLKTTICDNFSLTDEKKMELAKLTQDEASKSKFFENCNNNTLSKVVDCFMNESLQPGENYTERIDMIRMVFSNMDFKNINISNTTLLWGKSDAFKAWEEAKKQAANKKK